MVLRCHGADVWFHVVTVLLLFDRNVTDANTRVSDVTIVQSDITIEPFETGHKYDDPIQQHILFKVLRINIGSIIDYKDIITQSRLIIPGWIEPQWIKGSIQTNSIGNLKL